MERITSINPERIGWSIRERGVDLAQLANEVQIAERTLNDALGNRGGLTFAQLQRLAKYFNRGVLFFLEPDPLVERELYSPQFRTLENQKPLISPKVRGLIQRAEHQRDVYLDLSKELGLELGTFELPHLRGASPGEQGEQARMWLGLGETNTFETYRSGIEAKGILVFRTNGYNGAWQVPKDDKIEGFCIYERECPLIVVKKQEAEARQVFTLFHELGHLLLNRGSYIDDSDDLAQLAGVEQQANSFAGALLVPDRLLGRISRGTMPQAFEQLEDWLRPWRTAWAVSAEVILRRMLDKGNIEQSTHHAFREWKKQQVYEVTPGGSRAYRHREPLHVFGQTFTRTVLEALNRQQITTNKAGQYLDNLKLKDLRELEAHLAAH